MSEQSTTHNAAAPAAPAQAKSFAIADSAVQQLRKLLSARNTPQAGLRIAVKGGGCSGLSYTMDWADHPTEKDRVFERDGVRVFIDGKSLLYVAGSELVYEQTLMSSMFKVQNPNVKSTCGCGESFSV
ncbi:MAG TPA: iron-sulfur cluster assembly accessory protein [Myxococcaceae bacterium]|nr:iron-sulfur cluster assembly accessory protein [Myxococcaceae bacterium]